MKIANSEDCKYFVTIVDCVEFTYKLECERNKDDEPLVGSVKLFIQEDERQYELLQCLSANDITTFLKVLQEVYYFSLTSESNYIASTARLIKSLSARVPNKEKLCEVIVQFKHLKFLTREDHSPRIKQYKIFLQNNAYFLSKFVEFSAFLHTEKDTHILDFNCEASELTVKGT